MALNPNYDLDIKCIWCKEEFILYKNEYWSNPNICIKCKREMGIPIVNHGVKKNDDNKYINNHRIDKYRFLVNVPKSKVIKFVTYLFEQKVDIAEIIPEPEIPWKIYVNLSKSIQYDNFEFKNPIVYMGC
jgi:hypothetical protein